MKKFIGFLTATLLLFICNSTSALTIDVYNATDSTAIDNWINNLGGQVLSVENFDNSTVGWYDSLNTNIGEFKATGAPGTGNSSYPGTPDTAYFQINSGSKYGRTGYPYLDSSDVTDIKLTLGKNQNLSNLFFYIQDPSDEGAETIINSWSGSESGSASFINKSDSSRFFVGINAGNDLIDAITWSTGNNSKDGYGLDNFQTVAAVPVPAAVWLFGSGLLGLVGIRKKVALR